MMMARTPYSILQDQDDPDYPHDVFDDIFSTDSLGTAKSFVMWAMYHDTGIGNDDLDYWERCMIMKNHELSAAGWDAKIEAFSDFLTDLGNNGPDYTESELTSESVQKGYSPPSVKTSGETAEDYLADQNVNDFHQATKSGLQTETVRAWSDAMPSVLRDWALEFRKLFYWGL